VAIVQAVAAGLIARDQVLRVRRRLSAWQARAHWRPHGWMPKV